MTGPIPCSHPRLLALATVLALGASAPIATAQQAADQRQPESSFSLDKILGDVRKPRAEPSGTSHAAAQPAPAQKPEPFQVAPTLGDAQAALGLNLTQAAMNLPQAKQGLEVLGREPCDREAIIPLGNALARAGFRRDAAKALATFSERCGGHAPSLRIATNNLLSISENTGAAAVASRLIALEPYDNNAFYLRALAHDRAGDANRAIDDYVTAIELFPNRAQISSVSFFALARLHDRLGRPCDAAAAIERWVAIEPARYETTQTRAMIADFSSRGRCVRSRGGEDVVRFHGASQVARVRATINGVPGTFLVDTGASYVTMSRGFAEKAKVAIESEGTIMLATANGRVEAKRGRAAHIKLTRVEADDVPVVVQADNPHNYGDGVDGLLGMTFLSRFDMSMSGGVIRLAARR